MEKKNSLKANMPIILLLCFITYAILVLLALLKVTEIAPMAAVFMLLLEAVLAIFLVRIPMWMHGLVFIAQIVAGIIASQILFMVLMAIAYIIAIAYLYARILNE